VKQPTVGTQRKRETMKVLILGGGQGERLYPLTLEKPKWLVKLDDGTSIADRQLTWLKAQGVSKVAVTLARSFKDRVLDMLPLEKLGVAIEVIFEDAPCGDEGSVKRVLCETNSPSVLVINCDVLTDLPLRLLGQPPELVLVHPRAPWGVLKEEDGSFEEYPVLSIWVSSGIYHFPTSIRNQLVDSGKLAENIIPKLIKQRQLNFIKYPGSWRSIETIKDLRRAK
jgi:NDP-sugar pyrophosphorylase family protein